MESDALKTSLDDYNKLVTPPFNHMKHGGAPDAQSHHNGPAEHVPATVFDKSAHPIEPLITKDLNSPKIVAKEEERAVQKVLAIDSSMSIGMSAIGVSLFMLAAMLGVQMRRGLQQATAFASNGGHESDMSIALAPAAAGNILELKTQDSSVRGQVGWPQQSSKNSRPLTLCYATPSGAADFTDVQSLSGILAPTGYFDPAFLSECVSPSELKRNRKAELRHGRVAMLAPLGFLAGGRRTTALCLAAAVEEAPQEVEKPPERPAVTIEDCGFDPAPLIEQLRTGDFQTADQTTRDLLIEIAGPDAVKRGYVYWTEPRKIDNAALGAIENLWLHYSDGKFGYTVQKDVWRRQKGIFDKFCDKIGWTTEDEITGQARKRRWFGTSEFFYTLKEAPKGHLPLTSALRGTQLLKALLQHPLWETDDWKRDL
jgi:hypothetical protein